MTVIKLLSISSKPILYTQLVVLGLRLQRTFLLCQLLPAALWQWDSEGHGRLDEGEGRFSLCGLVSISCYCWHHASSVFQPSRGNSFQEQCLNKFAVFSFLAERASTHPFRDANTCLPALPLQKSESHFH